MRRCSWLWRSLVCCAVVCHHTAARAQAPLVSDGALTAVSKALPTGERYQEYRLSGLHAGLLVSVSAVATGKTKGFAPYLIITPPGGTQIDRKASNGVARGAFRVPQDGVATILVTSEKADEKGTFKLAVRYGAVEGELNAAEGKLDSGEFSTMVPLWLSAGTYTVGVTAETFGVYLICHVGESKTEVERDLTAPRSARAVVTLPAPGFVGVQVTTRRKGEQGKFKLTVADGVLDPVGVRTVKSRLGKGAAEEQGKWTDSWSFLVAKGHRYTLALSSPAAPARLVVYDGSGERHEASAGLEAARVTFDNLADGTAQVMVQALSTGQGGDYELRLETVKPELPPPAAPGAAVSSPPAVGRPSETPPVTAAGPSPTPPPVRATGEPSDKH